jgi:hypothetical protein
MHRAVKDIALILLGSLVATTAGSTHLCNAVHAKRPPRQTALNAMVSYSRETTRESASHERQTRLVKPITSSPVYARVVDFAGQDSPFLFMLNEHVYHWGSPYYFSSLCNKAPPFA